MVVVWASFLVCDGSEKPLSFSTCTSSTPLWMFSEGFKFLFWGLEGAWTTHAEDPRSCCSTHVKQLMTPGTPTPGGSTCSPDSTGTYAHTKKEIKTFEKPLFLFTIVILRKAVRSSVFLLPLSRPSGTLRRVSHQGLLADSGWLHPHFLKSSNIEIYKCSSAFCLYKPKLFSTLQLACIFPKLRSMHALMKTVKTASLFIFFSFKTNHILFSVALEKLYV